MSEPPVEDPHAADELALELARGTGEAERAARAVSLVVELLDGCDAAGITVADPHGFQTLASSSAVATACDRLQYELRQGPCVDTVRSHHTVFSEAVDVDPRWPEWGPLVASTHDIGSVYSLLLYTRAEAYGALNLYSRRGHGFTGDDLALAPSLAAHISVAAVDARQIDQLGMAMATRTVIGQAEGILMERYRVTAGEAFEMLRRRSQEANCRLVRLAEDLVNTGEWPGGSPAG